MFERLVESESTAELKPRRGYFLWTFIFVAILFLTAVVVSLYAEELDLGAGDLEMSMLIAPPAAVEPEPPEPQPPSHSPSQREQRELPNLHTNTLQINETPGDPPPISTAPSAVRSRPHGPFTTDLSLPESDRTGSRAPSANPGFGNPNGSPSDTSKPEIVKTEPEPEPPPVKKVEKPTGPVSLGVVNGRARHLPKPPYPAAAVAVRAEGDVTVQVTIDEYGNVISAQAVSGHVLLRQAAERAAWGAKFTPTTLSKVPVKVTGMIVYRFSRS